MSKLNNLKKDLREFENPEKAKVLQKFFKTGKDQYGEGDVFIGVTVPLSRKVAKKYSDLSFADIKKLLNSKIHEERLVAVLILVDKFQKGDEAQKEKVFDFYFKNSKGINNWDLVDSSADKIAGAFLFDKKSKRKIIYDLAKSNDLWQKRISIISTFYFIKNNDFNDTLKISKILLNDDHDLMHKAVGWMLREVGKRDMSVEENFLKKHYKKMPRTMLRYAIEKFPEELRQRYLKGDI